ncbi:MAG: hypothetical protein HKN42_15835 [Granulosicoccus sp.]|nr:hypothetical protein [Granulosicoccus sp.]
MNQLRAVVATLLALFFAGCEGDARPFEEAVEIREASIIALDVVPPPMSVDSLIMNIGQSVQFSVQGRTADGQNQALSAGDRQWQVDNPAFASIDRNGMLRALADGPVSVTVSIGGLESAPYVLSVQNEILSAINDIEGQDIIERCRPAEYLATGVYGDSIRDLSGVTWTLAESDANRASLNAGADSRVSVTGLETGTVQLTATVGSISSLPKSIEISDTLTELQIRPESATISVDDVQNFIATGVYAGDELTTRNIDISDVVQWRIVTGAEFASVSNDADARGQVTGLSSGSATLSASCGNLSQSVVLTVAEDNDASSSTLSFEQDSPVTLFIGGAEVILRVSTGTTFSSSSSRLLDNDDLQWSYTDSRNNNDQVILLDTDGVNAGRIRPSILTGTATVTATRPSGGSVSISVRVTSN